MTKTLYLDDMNQREFEAVIISVKDGKYVVLDQTAFYPKSGGVDGDLGNLVRKSDGIEFNVIFTGKFKGEISHEVDKEGLRKGDKVHGKIDWERRYELMRYHTAAHVLSGAFFKEGKVKVTGNNIEIGQGRIDFNFPDFERSLIENYVSRSNKVIEENLSVVSYYVSRDELEKDKDLVKLAMGLPKNIENVRIVDIEGFDKQPDGGCHVTSLAEIGKIEITKIKNKGKNNRRLYFTLI
ncbi:MAG: alanyl-tRNA editing protein [archaeon]|nr:alanyl-tRNA editing protein [archaeon]